jgi:hypothetical protein
MRDWFTLAAILLGSTLLAILATTPPGPKPADAPSDQFSAARAMEDIRVIASEPHPTGSEANAKVRAYIIERLEGLGLAVTTTTHELPEYSLGRLGRWGADISEPPPIVNIIATIPGKDRDKPALLLMAHHDSVWASPGAADDTTGIATILEVLRAIQQDGQAERDLIIVITDAEELGLAGATRFFTTNPLADRIGAIINLEARGGGGRTSMFQTNEGNGEGAQLFASSVSQPGASSLAVFVYSLMPNDTDLSPALLRDYIAYNFAFIGRPEQYHSPLATPDRLDQGSLQHMGSQTLDLTRALLAAEELPGKAPNATFFDVFGLFTLAYPAGLGWLLLTGGILACQAASWNRKPWKEVLFGALRMLGLLLFGAVWLEICNALSVEESAYNYYDRLAATSRLEVMSLLVCCAAIVLFFPKSSPTKGAIHGALLPLFVIGVVGQFFAPTATYFVSLALLLGGLGWLTMEKLPGKAGTIVAGVLATIVIGYELALGHLVLQGVVQQFALAAMGPAIIIAAILLPFWPGMASRKRYLTAGLFAFAALGISMWVRFDAMAETIPPYAGFG